MEHISDPMLCAEHLAQAVRFPTVSSAKEADMDFEPFFAFHRYLEKTYPLVHKTLTREMVGTAGLLYHWKGTGKSESLPVLLMAHQDVVPEGNKSMWKYPPYAGTIADGKVWGRGASDCKSHLISQLEAIEYLIKSGFVPDYDIYLSYGYNEEVSAERPAAKAAAELLKSRGIKIGAVLDEGGGMRGNGFRGTKGDVCLFVLGEKGYADYEIVKKDPGGHSSRPRKGGALSYIGRAICAIEDNPMPYRVIPVIKQQYAVLAPFVADRELGKLMEDVETNLDALKPYFEKDPDMESMFHTTIAMTMTHGSEQANILPEEASVTVNCRILNGDTVESVGEYLRSIVPAECEVRLIKGFDPSPVSVTDCEMYQVIQDVYREEHPDMVVVDDIMGAGTDAKYMYTISDCVYRFASFYRTTRDANNTHSVNENMDIKDLSTGPDFYVSLLKHYGHDHSNR